MTENIFDISNLDDIPESIITDTKLGQSNELQTKIMGVLQYAEGPVSSTLMIIAVFRLYDTTVKKTVMNSTLSHMRNIGLIERPRYAHYALIREVTNEVEVEA